MPISQIIEKSLIDLYGINGYKTIIQTIMKETKKSEMEITENYELFEKFTQGIFGRIGESKILEPVKMEINKNESRKTKQIKLLIADDEPHLLELYQDGLKMDYSQVITAENGLKCLDIYKNEHANSKSNQTDNYFDVVILDYNMPILNGAQTASEILKINPSQRIIFASGYMEMALADSLIQLDKVTETIKKPFSIEGLKSLINKKNIQ